MSTLGKLVKNRYFILKLKLKNKKGNFVVENRFFIVCSPFPFSK